MLLEQVRYSFECRRSFRCGRAIPAGLCRLRQFQCTIDSNLIGEAADTDNLAYIGRIDGSFYCAFERLAANDRRRMPVFTSVALHGIVQIVADSPLGKIRSHANLCVLAGKCQPASESPRAGLHRLPAFRKSDLRQYP